MSDLTRNVFLAETAAVNQHLAGSSAVDQARAVLQQFASVPGFVDAIERFEAAVRANERSGETRAAALREGADAVAELMADGEHDPDCLVDELRRLARQAQP